MRIKYKSKMRKTLFFLTLAVFLQEILVWFSLNPSTDIIKYRILYAFWIVISLSFIFISSKVYKTAAIVLISSKTALFLIEVIYLNLFSSDIRNSRLNIVSYILVYHCMIDTLVFVSIGIVPVMFQTVANPIYLVVALAVALSTFGDQKALPSLILSILVHFAFNIIDIFNHFGTELSLFFNFINIE